MRDIASRVNSLSREKIQSTLEAYGFAVFDNEDTEKLREALVVNIEDNTISESCLHEEYC